MTASQAIFNQLLPQIARSSLDKGVKALHPASPAGVLPTRPHYTCLRQFLARKLFGQVSDFQYLVDSDSEVLGLLFHPVAKLGAGFGGIDKIEPEDVFVSFNTDVETVAIVRSFDQIMTALQRDPRRMSKRIGDARRQKEYSGENRANKRMSH